MNKKQMVCEALRGFINQRSGIDGRNYGNSREAFLGDYRPMLRHGKQARAMLRAVELRDSITAQDIISAAKSAFSGRLEITMKDGTARVDYTTGQYFPTEYRKAACAVLASVLWGFWMPDYKTADAIRNKAKREFGPAIARTWFN